MKITGTRLESFTIDNICNKCGESCMRFDDYYGVDIEYQGGYHSGSTYPYTSKISDSERISISLCEDCLSKLLEECILNPSPDYSGKPTDSPLQDELNQVYAASEEDLAIHLLSERSEIRNYAEVQMKKLKQSKES